MMSATTSSLMLATLSKTFYVLFIYLIIFVVVVVFVFPEESDEMLWPNSFPEAINIYFKDSFFV